MKLKSITIERFKNIVDAQTVEIEDDVTCLIGKNESGKTTILTAIYRLNPATATDGKFDLTTEYPRWRLSRDRRKETLEDFTPVRATFILTDIDLSRFEDYFGVRFPEATTLEISRSYRNVTYFLLRCPLIDVVRTAAEQASVDGEDLEALLQSESATAATERAKNLAKELRDDSKSARAKAVGAFPNAMAKYAVLTGTAMSNEDVTVLAANLPKFFYFSSYDVLPGHSDLDDLAQKVSSGVTLNAGERTMVALLSRADETPSDFLDEDYESRTAELQAASADLTQRVFDYWRQNTDLKVVFSDDLRSVVEPSSRQVRATGNRAHRRRRVVGRLGQR